MRTSLACHVSVRHFGVWRVAVWLLALSSLATLVAWVVSGQDLWSTGARAAAAVAATAVLGLAASLARVRPATLRLHEGSWTVTRHDPATAETPIARMDVELDLGSFMLLSFRPMLASGRPGGRRWLPVQRRGHEGDWHRLRCAVHSGRPAAPGPVARATAPPE